jgi:phage tail sheath protein FI
MAFQLSPGVNVSEIDLTNVVPAVATSIGAFAGEFSWGPASTITTIDSENLLASTFGKPTSNSFTSFFTAANFLSYSNNLKIVRAIGSSAKNASADTQGELITNEDIAETTYTFGAKTDVGPFAARYPGTLGNSLTISVCSATNSFSYTTTANVTSSSNVAVLPSTVSAANAKFTTGDTILIGSNTYTISTSTVNESNTTIVLTTPYIGSTANGVSAPAATLKWKYAAYFDSAPGTSQFGETTSSTNDELHVIVIDSDAKFSGIKDGILEKYSNVSKAGNAKTDDGSPNFYATKIFNQSKYIYAIDTLSGATDWGQDADHGPDFDQVANYTVKLAGGVDASPGDAELVTAFGKYSNSEEVDISLLISGPATQTVATSVLSIANQRKDCVAFISPLKADAVDSINMDKIIEYRNNLLSAGSSYGVMDSAWKYQFDKYNNKYRYVPLNGDIAGLCARTDSIRDPWFSPAGFNRGQILNAIKLSWNPSKTQRDELYKNGINPVVAFPGEGIVLYGDKTLQAKPSAFDRINVRRLFITLEKAISTAAKYSLFEFNDEFTRSQFVSLVEPFLRDVKGRRGIYDYSVVCDGSNNTAEVVDSNRFVGDIYIKPAKSINFIQLNFVAVRSGVEFVEIAGKF